MPINHHLKLCNSGVKSLCNKGLTSYDNKNHDKCEKTKKELIFLSCYINTFLSLVLTKFGTKYRESITIKGNTMEDYKNYQVCTTLKKD